MKFLLVAINAKYIHSNLAVYSLKAYQEKYGKTSCKVEIAEYTINQYTDEILMDIYQKGADAIGFSCYIWNISYVLEIAENYKKISPNTDIWLGGPEVSYNMEQVLKTNTFIDGIMYGEGEEVFKNLIDNYGNKNIRGTALRRLDKSLIKDSRIIESNLNLVGNQSQPLNGINQIVINEPELPLDLSDIPFVYKDMKEFENKIIYYETSRGCPFSCSYCLSSIDKRIRFRDIEMVKEELDFFLANKTAQVKFVDRTFNCNPKRSLEIWKYVKEQDNGITNFHFEIAADLMTDEEIELIATMRPGLIQLETGVQSTNIQTIDAINRKTDFQKIAKVTSKIKEGANIHQHLDLIAGLPFEDYYSFGNSFNDVYALKPDQLQLGFLKVLHGSMMEEYADKYGIVYNGQPPYEVLKTPWLTFDEVIKLKTIENVVEIYYNSLQFTNTIERLEKDFDTAFNMYEKLGEYYKNKSLGNVKHSRVDRYNLLLDFATRFAEDDESYRELLTLDFYLRENAKTRPRFSKDITPYKKQIRDAFYTENIRTVLPEYGEYDSKQMIKMTHVEVFGICNKSEKYILFNYKNRNPLNNQAQLTDITELIEGTKNDK